MTQLAFSFTTAPFVILALPASILVWYRVYFYGVIGTAASVAFFASPGKAWLIQKLKKRNQSALQRVSSREMIEHPLMGLPGDPAGDIDEAVREIRDEVEARRRRGTSVSMPTGTDMKAAVEDRLGKKL